MACPLPEGLSKMMNLASWLPTTLIDYPEHVAATLFTLGCNFRCPFCHNPELVLPERVAAFSSLDVGEVLAELERRRGFLDGVVLTGGEPTLQEDLVSFAEGLKQLGLLVKLDTNGSRPEVVRSLLARNLIDYVAVDVKAPLARYEVFAGSCARPTEVEETVSLLKGAGTDYEFRTTVAPGLALRDIEAIAAWIGPARRYVLQAFHVPRERTKGLLDPAWAEREALDASELMQAWAAVEDWFEAGGVRA